MKELIRFSNIVKPKASLYFSGILAIFGVTSFYLGYRSISIITLFQMMVVSLMVAIIEYYLFLNDDEFTKQQNQSHTIIWAILTNILIIGAAILFQWVHAFPLWMVITLIIMFEIALIFFRYSVYLKNEYDTKMLNKKLQKYQTQQ